MYTKSFSLKFLKKVFLEIFEKFCGSKKKLKTTSTLQIFLCRIRDWTIEYFDLQTDALHAIYS